MAISSFLIPSEPLTTSSQSLPENHHEPEEFSNTDATSDASSTTVPTTQTRMKRFGRKTKSKTKRLLHIDDTTASLQSEQDGNGIFKDLEDNPAFNPTTVDKPSTLDKLSGSLQTAGNAVLHPRHCVKAKTAATLATTEKPYFSKEAEDDLLDAHGELGKAQAEANGGGSDFSSDGAQKWEKTISDIEARREMTKVAWTTGRFCHRVRVMPTPSVKFPSLSQFQEFDENGKLVRFRWEKWIGHLLLYITQGTGSRYIDDSADLPYNRDVLVQNIERIIMASAPWQEWALGLRSVYRWEEPSVTGAWFAVWMMIWWLNCTISFTLCYIVFIVLRNRFRSQSIDALRASHERAIDRGTTARRFGELINRHGKGDWVDPLMDSVGPTAQVQLGDVADMLEILANFYNWKCPRLTWYTVFFICTCTFVGLVASADFSLKVFKMICIWWFFLGRFVASYHPQYRHLVSPVKYVFWDIPTHAEWSFQYLCKTAQEVRQKMIERKIHHQHDTETYDRWAYGGHAVPESTQTAAGSADESDDDWQSANSSSGIIDDTDFICFQCKHDGVHGQLVIYSDGIRFIRKFPKKEMWRRSFGELVEMNKFTGSRTKKLKKDRLLEFTFLGGVVEQLEAVKRRDEAFNSIVGFSGLRWQQLQPRHDANIKT